MATTSIAEENADIVATTQEINKIMEKNKEVSTKLSDIISSIKVK